MKFWNWGPTTIWHNLGCVAFFFQNHSIAEHKACPYMVMLPVRWWRVGSILNEDAFASSPLFLSVCFFIYGRSYAGSEFSRWGGDIKPCVFRASSCGGLLGNHITPLP